MPASDAPYPRAAILTAWVNAWVAGGVDGLASCPAVSPAAAVSAEVGAGQELPAVRPSCRADLLGRSCNPWADAGAARGRVRDAAARHRAAAGSGDPAGLPPEARAARDSGEVAVLSDGRPGDPHHVLFPATGGDRAMARWRMERAYVAPAALVTDLRTARLQIMELLPASLGWRSLRAAPMSDAGLRERLRLLEEVPLPSGSAPAAVELARRSASLLAIVDAAAEGLDGDPMRRAELMPELRPLATAAGRRWRRRSAGLSGHSRARARSVLRLAIDRAPASVSDPLALPWLAPNAADWRASAMPKEPIWWARTTVDWQSEDLQDQLVLLPAGSARHALAWRDVMACTTWTEVRHVAPGLEAELRDYAEGCRVGRRPLRLHRSGRLRGRRPTPPPERAMDQRLPRDLIDTLGVSEDTVFDGPFVRFPGTGWTPCWPGSTTTATTRWGTGAGTRAAGPERRAGVRGSFAQAAKNGHVISLAAPDQTNWGSTPDLGCLRMVGSPPIHPRTSVCGLHSRAAAGRRPSEITRRS